ncbi:MAG: hypothetical protein ACI83H_002554 [Glaciecola sp.]|jgi:hypothetical protein
MHIARIKSTNEPIEAEELKFLAIDDMPEFVCADESCNVQLVPASFQPHNRQKPHFRTQPKKEHSPTCKFSEYIRILNVGGKRKITFEEFENLPVPTKLVVPKKNEKDSYDRRIEETGDEEGLNPIKRRSNNGTFDEGGNSFKSVSTISQIVDFYLRCPFNRDMELTLFEQTKQYMFWFRRLQNTVNNPEHIEPQETNVYFGQLLQGDKGVKIDSNEIRLNLYDCQGWEESKFGKSKKQINPVTVHINKSNLSKNKSSRIINEIEFVLAEQLNTYRNKTNSKNKPFIFFIGRKNNMNTPYEYEVIDGHFVARYAEVRRTVRD